MISSLFLIIFFTNISFSIARISYDLEIEYSSSDKNAGTDNPSLYPTNIPSTQKPVSKLHTGSPFTNAHKTPAPTHTPAIAPDILKIDVSQDIENCNALGYYTDHGAQLAFEHTVVSLIPGLDLGDVDVTVVEDSPDIFRAVVIDIPRHLNRKLRSTGVTIDYTISMDYIKCGYQNESIAYSKSSDLLTQYIDNGDFTYRLREMAIVYNSTCMSQAIASESRLRISSPFDKYPLMPPVITPFPTLSKRQQRIQKRVEEVEVAADDVELSVVIMLLSSSIFFCLCSVCIVKKRYDWVYRRQSTFDDDALIRETEMTPENENTNTDEGERKKGDEETVWFNKG
mmetsp:Transcript_33752/g.34388  ORF Transcript_33752/g.34388 Transcript_33752/m.34388 type:complete len:341 (+) Transcript_33752:125-1147(+)